ncbi:hypothetical protein EDC91_10378 [Shewanella fodinae]|uniref:Uncharacterized protein n=1 Tax=Shewanella fodinae TaxID=552357 RepID=A0A4R2FHR4_9GAMM|nr:hypothetical protein EDC91_10378 [Shewanella fodinae]
MYFQILFESIIKYQWFFPLRMPGRLDTGITNTLLIRHDRGEHHDEGCGIQTSARTWR